MTTKPNPAEPNGNALVRIEAPKEAGPIVRLQTRRLSYQTRNPECRAFPVAGWLLDRMDLVINDKPRTAYIIRLTQPSRGVDQDDKVHAVAAGQELILWGTWELDKELAQLATHPTQVAFVAIQPDKEVAHPKKKGQTLWTFRIDVGTQPRPRIGFCLPPGRNNQAAGLPMGNGVGPTASENDAGEVPFA